MKNLILITLFTINISYGQIQPFNYGGEFVGEVIVPEGANPSNAVNLGQMNTALSSKANDSDVVKISGNQSIAGTKTFSISPIVPSKSTAAGNNTTTIATEAQVYDSSLNNAKTNQQNTFSEINTFQNRLEFDTFGTGWPYSGFTNNYIKPVGIDVAFGTYASGVQRAFAFRTSSLTPNRANIFILPDVENAVLVVDDTFLDVLEDVAEDIPGYNASVSQVLGHDASGNLQWQTLAE